ncbi:MAG: dephospho-CoA kinase [Flavobacteriales bacterium]|nr:dephospho-CoA kinase [Flavobacteriales bacterium]
MNVIGITGGIGSGKSLVSQILREKGFSVYDSDKQAKLLMNTNQELISQIKNHFGSSVYKDGNLDRKLLAKMVFSDSELLQKLNALVHPEVDKDFNSWKDKNNQKPIIFKESAILYESGTFKKCNAVLLVTADKELRILRTIQRDQTTREQVLMRMQNQWREERKIELADFVLFNNGTISQLNEKVEDILKEIIFKFGS